MATIRKQEKKTDAGRVLVDEQLESLESDISRLYANASKEMREKSDAFLEDYWRKDTKMRARVEAGEITEEQLKSWRKGQAYQSEKMSAQVADLTQTMLNADKTAMAMVGDKIPDVYATSYNFAGYRGEKYAQAVGRDYTSFTIYNREAVKQLVKGDPDLLPPKVDIPKDERWNRQHIQNAIAQGIVQGEPVNDIANRLMAVTTMDENAALRNARTAVNGIENKARHDATEQLKEDGIPMVYTWSATHDGRTRESHVLLDGQHPDENGYFENGLRYPADPDGDPAEVYNCRCLLLTEIEGIDHSKDDELYDQFMQENDYESWLALKENERLQANEQAFQKHKEEALAKRAEAEQLAKENAITPDNAKLKDMQFSGKEEALETLRGLSDEERAAWENAVNNTEYRINKRDRGNLEVGGEYYDPNTGKVNIFDDTSSNTFFHETAHANDNDAVHISYDYIIKDKDPVTGEWIERTNNYSYDGSASGAAEAIYDAMADSYKVDDKALMDWLGVDNLDATPQNLGALRTKLKEFGDEYGENAMMNLSDMIDGHTGGKFPLIMFTGGHGKQYWESNALGVRREAWAEICETKISNKKAIDEMREVLPRRVSANEKVYNIVYEGGEKYEQRNTNTTKGGDRISTEIFSIRKRN